MATAVAKAEGGTVEGMVGAVKEVVLVEARVEGAAAVLGAVRAAVAVAQRLVDMAEAKEEAMAAAATVVVGGALEEMAAKVEVVHTRPSRLRKAGCARCTPRSTT